MEADRSAARGQLGPDFHQRDEDNIDASREQAGADFSYSAGSGFTLSRKGVAS